MKVPQILVPFFASLALSLISISSGKEIMLTPIMDASVSEAEPDRNYGTGNLVIGKFSNQAWGSFLRFDFGQIPVNAEITSATLNLVSTNFRDGGMVRISQPALAWGEAEITWGNSPNVSALDEVALNVLNPNNANLEFTETTINYIQTIVNSVEPNHGFHLSLPGATAEQFLPILQRETDDSPKLVITYDLGPELPDFRGNLTTLAGPLRAGVFSTPEGEANPYELIWNTQPGVRYRLWESPNLDDWTIVPGFPIVADSLGANHQFSVSTDAWFYRVESLDEQAPEIVSRFPDENDFGIKRFYSGKEIEIQLSDNSGIDPTSVALRLGEIGTYTISDPELEFVDSLLTLDLGSDTAMGDFGAEVEISLTVADPLANSVTYNWTFALEKELVLVDGLFTFGSPEAQRVGQRVPPIPTRMLADRLGGGGPVKAGDAEWVLAEVTPDSLVITYTSAPAFSIDQYLTNLTPATVKEIFYRKVTSIEDDTVAKRLTLGTVDVPSWEVIQNASLALAPDDMAYEIDGDGRIVRAYALKSISANKTFTLQPLSVNWEDQSVFGLYDAGGDRSAFSVGLPIPDEPPTGGDWQAKINLKQGLLKLSPEFSIAVDMSFFTGLKKLRSETEIRVDLVLEPELEFLAPAVDFEWNAEDGATNEPLIKYDIVIPLGTTPLWITVSPRLRLEAQLKAGLTGTVSGGLSGGYSRRLIFDYDKNRSPSVKRENVAGDHYFELIEPEIFGSSTVVHDEFSFWQSGSSCRVMT